MRFLQPAALMAPLRTPMGKSGGMLAGFEAYELQAIAFRAVLEQVQAGLRHQQHEMEEFTSRLEDVIVGNVTNSIGNVARVAALAAGIPDSVPAATVDRQCASSMEAVVLAASKINAGLASAVLVGGVESASRAPWLLEKTARAYAPAPPKPLPIRLAPPGPGDVSMGETAEILADEFAISRAEMDAYALESHRRAAAASDQGQFKKEIIPLEVPQRKGPALILDRDESIRADTSLEALGRLPAAFRPDGRVTAGNSSPVNDGATAALVASEGFLNELNIEPFAWIRGAATVALRPQRMGMGPALAIPLLLENFDFKEEDIDLFEINEAFAAQVLAVNRALRIPSEKLNVNGGALALGHPLGVSGLRIVVTLVHALKARGLRRGVAALCVGGGQGMAVLVEIP